MRIKGLIVTLVVGLGLTMGLLALSSGHGTGLPAVHAAELHVCPSGCTYSSIQAAVDAAIDGDVIKVATGTYTGVSTRAGVTQVVYLNKSVTIRGGYTTAFTEPPDPEANPIILDAEEQGRVLYITGNITPTVEGLHITGGSVEASGGGIYVKDANLALIHTVISNNTSSGTNWPDGLGGGVYVEAGSATVSGGQIISNSASYKGGGLCIWNGRVTLDGAKIVDNIANGPTYWDGGGGVWVLGSAALSGGQIASNSASHGGGLYVYLSDVTLNAVQISDNSVTWAGGGVFIWPGGSVTLEGVELSNNSAHSGGGVHSGGIFTLTNGVVSDNRADLGSGLYIEGASSQLLHTTIVRNSDSGVHLAGSSTVTMTNTIVATHTIGITITGGSIATLESTLWHGNTADWGGAGTIHHSNDHTGDPAFLAPDGGDYHIGAGSAAVDAGVDAGVAHDIDGDLRPFDGDDDGADEFDIGADEYVRRYIYLPLVLRKNQ